MLVLDSSATCDLCLRLYNGFDVAPHFLPCGHVSCGSCLARILVEPRGASCSWCRTGFSTGDIRKLHCHVTATGAGLLGDEREAARARARAYELQLADTLKYSGSVTKTRKLVNNIVEWLEEQPRDDHLVLRTTVTLAAKYITDHQGKTKEAAVELSLRTRVVELEAKLETQARDIKQRIIAAAFAEENGTIPSPSNSDDPSSSRTGIPAASPPSRPATDPLETSTARHRAQDRHARRALPSPPVSPSRATRAPEHDTQLPPLGQGLAIPYQDCSWMDESRLLQLIDILRDANARNTVLQLQRPQ